MRQEAMKIKCQCGRELEVEPGVTRAKCPDCGREVEVKPAEDWVSSVDVDDISLEEPAGPPEEHEVRTEQPVAPERAPAEGPEELELEEVEAPAAAPAPAEQMPESAPRPAGEKAAETEAAEEALPPPQGLISVAKTIINEPKAALPYFETGIKDRQLIIQMAVVFAVLAFVCAIPQFFPAGLRKFGIGGGLASWFSIVCELASAGIMLSLLCVAFKKDLKPLGIAQGLALVRIGSLLVMAPICLIVALLLILTSAGEGPPGGMIWVARHLQAGYMAVVFLGQASFIISMLKLGCLPGLALSLVLTYAGYSMAAWLMGAS